MEEKKGFNQYLTYYKRRPTEELKEIALQKDLYHVEARMAAVLELRSRDEDISEEEYKELELLVEKDKQAKTKEVESLEQSKVTGTELPEYYSPAAILGFSIFFSVIFGGVLMFTNLRKAGKKTEATAVIVVSLCIMLVSAYLVHVYQMNQWVALLANVSGAIILIEYFWKKHLGYQTKFKRKPLTNAILISLGVSILFAVILFYYFPEQFPQV